MRLKSEESTNYRSKMIYGVRIVPHDIHLQHSAIKREDESEELEQSFAGIRIGRKKQEDDDEQA